MSTIALTYIYSEFWGTEQFRKSAERVGLSIHNAFSGTIYTGGPDVLRMFYDSFHQLRGKYDKLIYADAADSVFIRAFEPPDGKIIYSTEKACYPHPSLAAEYPDPKGPWRYLNGGGFCGSIDLLIEFYDKYGLTKHVGDLNGQYIMALAYLQAKKDGFPIELDQDCQYFQTTAFEDPADFGIPNTTGKDIMNLVTGTMPHLWHGNGRTDMTWIYKLFPDDERT